MQPEMNGCMLSLYKRAISTPNKHCQTIFSTLLLLLDLISDLSEDCKTKIPFDFCIFISWKMVTDLIMLGEHDCHTD